MRVKNRYKVRHVAAALINMLTLMGMLLNIPAVKAETSLSGQATPAVNLAVVSVPQTLTSGEIVEQKLNFNPEPKNADADNDYPYNRTFIISAYYSPLPGQNKYVTGSYKGDIRLNGGGVRGADGTNVYPGMIAAPRGYDFGIKMKIPGLGVAAVHDRGGAIVHSGVRNNAHDRLDVWMGYGDAGRIRAMKWGKRTVDVEVLGKDSTIKEYIALEGFSEAEKIIINNTLTAGGKDVQASTDPGSVKQVKEPEQQLALQQASFGSKNENVKKIQQILKATNYYHGEINSTFDEQTRAALAKFQVSENVIRHEKDFGAGYAGPKTLKVLSAKIGLIKAHAQEETYNPTGALARDLKFGDTGEEVRKLQAELKKMNLLGIEPTGYYGEVTAHAVLKFQQKNLLAGDTSSPGAGIFGPMTRATLNDIVATRLRTEQLIAARQKEDLI